MVVQGRADVQMQVGLRRYPRHRILRAGREEEDTMHRFRRVAFVLLMTLVAPMVVMAGPATARPLECNPDSMRYSITSSSKDILMTHEYRYATLDVNAYGERTISSTTTFTAGITVNASATAQAGVIFAKAEVSVGFSLMAQGSTTSTESFSDGVKNTTSKPHTWVWFEGTKRGNGGWKSDRCTNQGQWQSYDSGTWKSWNAQFSGVLRCDHDADIANQFGSFSPEYKAVKTC
jgi:hypothetical protein